MSTNIAILFSIINNILSQLRAQTTHIRKQVHTGGVQIHTNLIHTTFHHKIETFL